MLALNITLKAIYNAVYNYAGTRWVVKNITCTRFYIFNSQTWILIWIHSFYVLSDSLADFYHSHDLLLFLIYILQYSIIQHEILKVCSVYSKSAPLTINKSVLYLGLWGGRVSPPRGPPWATSKKAKHTQTFHRTRFFYFFVVKFLCVCFPVVKGFSLRLLCLFSNSFQFKFFIYSLYIHIYIFYIFFHCTHCRSTHNSSTIFLCVCSGFSLASWCWSWCLKETIAI